VEIQVLDKPLAVSLLMPTLNAGKAFADVLNSIDSQSLKIKKKLIIDSGSKDDTVALATAHGFAVTTIHKNDFNHGKTRQQLADLAGDTDICVFLTQDAILASADSLTNLLTAFTDTETGIAYGRQLPHQNARTLESHARLFNYPAVSQIRSFVDRDRIGFKTIFCSNSFAAYRKTALNRVGGFPFDSIMGEDTIVAAKMLSAGYKIAYVADAAVFHSHTYSISEEFRRYFDTGVFHTQNNWLFDTYEKPSGEGLKFIRSELKYVFKHDLKSLPKSVLSTGAKWLGYKTGKGFKKLPHNVVRKFSMHRFYWDQQKKQD
jgi:rhamnosyltransferase